MKSENIDVISRVFENVPLKGKIILNQETSLSKLSLSEFKNVTKVLNHLTIEKEDESKGWFIQTDKLFKEKNLRIFNVSFEKLKKIIMAEQFEKLPDPRYFLIGVTYVPRVNKGDILKQLKESIRSKNISFSSFSSKKQ